MSVRLTGESSPVQSPIQPVPGTIAGEHPPRAIRSVSARRQTHDEEFSVGVSERGHRPPPVVIVGVPSSLFPGHLSAPLHQARALGACHHTFVQREQVSSIFRRGFPQRCTYPMVRLSNNSVMRWHDQMVARSGGSVPPVVSKRLPPINDRADERTHQGPNRPADHRHHRDGIEMAHRGSATRYGPVHAQREKEPPTDRSSVSGPSSSVQETCLQEGVSCRYKPLSPGSKPQPPETWCLNFSRS